MMRADRLLEELLILQGRGQVTASVLAAELEVSERTVYRDMEALAMAGVPVISLAGPGGGYSLYGNWRADLSGFRDEDVMAISVALAGGSASGAATDRLQGVLRRMIAGLPESSRRGLDRLQRWIHIDASPAAIGTVLGAFTAALGSEQGVRVEVTGPSGTTRVAVGTPLGLVAVAGSWYLVWAPRGRKPRADHLDHIAGVSSADSPAESSEGFDLEAFWTDWQRRKAATRRVVSVVLAAEEEIMRTLRRHPGVTRIERATRGRTTVEIDFESFPRARTEVLGWGGAVEVLSPRALRLSVADFAQQTSAQYR